MNRRSFFESALSSAAAASMNHGPWDDLLTSLRGLDIKIDTYAREATEAIGNVKNHSFEMMNTFASDLDKITNQMSQLRAQQYVFLVWLTLLSLLTGIDLIHPAFAII